MVNNTSGAGLPRPKWQQESEMVNMSPLHHCQNKQPVIESMFQNISLKGVTVKLPKGMSSEVVFKKQQGLATIALTPQRPLPKYG